MDPVLDHADSGVARNFSGGGSQGVGSDGAHAGENTCPLDAGEN